MKRLIISFFLIIMGANIAYSQNDADLFYARDQVNAMCPKIIDEATILKNVTFGGTGSVFMYNYIVDESKLKMSAIKNVLSVMAERIKANHETPVSYEFIQACIKTNVVIMHQYVGNQSNEACWITYYPKNKRITIMMEN